MAEVFGVAASAIALIELFAKIGVLCSVYCAGVKAAQPSNLSPERTTRQLEKDAQLVKEQVK